MDGNLSLMLISLALYITSLGIASAKKSNMKALALVSILAAFWFGYQWQSWKGILAVFVGMFVGIFILKLVVGNKMQSRG